MLQLALREKKTKGCGFKKMNFTKVNFRKKCLTITVGCIVIILLVAFNLGFISVESIINYAETSGWTAAIGFALLYVIKGLAMVVPSSLLYISAGMVFNPLIGILITYAGLTVSLSIGYFFGKKIGEKRVAKMLTKQKKLADFFDVENKEKLLSLCFMSRMLHLPFGLSSLFFGALNMPFWKHIFASLLGITPIMIPAVLAGAAASNPISAEFLIPFSISLGITLAIFIIYKLRV